MVEQIIKFFRKYNELILGPLGIVLWFVSAPILHYIDPTAATYDLAVFQKLLFGLMTFNVCTANALLLIRLVNPSVFKFLTQDFDTAFSTLNNNSWEKLKLSFAVWACFLFGLLMAMQVL
ncbi:hypothetical protein ACFQ21_00145 [Ohtaekwangia kribbensis]|jgi:hypothetical protein|uniref:Fumarate reductase subunit C n=1 Tax=Ohtaekwangia kribbensis TaxID=688913 RepID=A0ABW3JV19_9BACT